MMAGLSDGELLQACRKGDERAWQQVVDRYKRLVFSIPLNYGLSREDAADIMQLTFLMLLHALDSLRPDSHLGGWLTTVARRNSWHVIDRRVRENRRLLPLDDDSPLPDERDEVDREQRERNQWLQDGLAELEEFCRTLLTLLYLHPDELSYKEVAARLGRAEGSIGPMRIRCLGRLRDIMRKA